MRLGFRQRPFGGDQLFVEFGELRAQRFGALIDGAQFSLGARQLGVGGARALMKSPVSDNFEFPVQASVVPWLRACARRNGIAFEPVGQ